LPPRTLRSAIDRTIQQQEPVILEEIPMEAVQAGEHTYLQISCHPQVYNEHDGVVRHILLLIQDVTRMVQDRRQIQAERDQQQALTEQLQQQINDLMQNETTVMTTNRQLQQRVETLEEAQVQATVEIEQQHGQIARLQEVNQELVRANENLTSTNQELRVMNDEFLMTSEEAQAATEEVETLSEETQATNEELETLNEELQGTIEELTTTVNDLTVRNDALQQECSDLEIRTSALQGLVQHMSDAALLVDAEGNELFANDAYGALQEYDGSMEDEEGHKIGSDSTPQARAARGETFTMTCVLRSSQSDPLWLEVQGGPIPGAEERGGMIIIRRR
jgi:two-component system CheB/CheR fusion protein